jgi:hypothetical protein
MGQVVGFSFIGSFEEVQGIGHLQTLSNGGRSHIYKHFNKLRTCTYHIGPRTHHVDHVGAALVLALDILNGATKLVGIKLDEGPSLLHRKFATFTMNLEGFELSMFVEINDDPVPVGLPL